MHEKVISFINVIRVSFVGSEIVYTEGSCFKFHLILKEVFPDAECYDNSQHIITKIDGRYYDITGEVPIVNHCKVSPGELEYERLKELHYKHVVNPRNIMTREEAVELIVRDKIVFSEFVDFFIGKLIDAGSTRLVFENAQDSTTVIKIDVGNRNANIMEHDVWSHIQYTEFAKWFAPVKNISRCGRIMIQKKCKPLKFSKLPEKLPVFFTDIQTRNFGMYQGRVVALDYELHLLKENGMTRRMKKVKWHIG